MSLARWFLCAMLCIALVFPVIGHAQDVTSGPVVNSAPNDPTTGTILNRLAKITPTGTLVLAATTDTAIKLYVVIAGAGTTGTAVFVEAGRTGCEMDSVTTNKAGTYLVNSPTTPGRCHQQDAPPANGMVVGELRATSTVVGGVAQISAQNVAYIPGSGAASTSVGLTMPAEFTVAGSPVVNSGTLTVTEATQAANTAYMGPTTGAAAAPGYRALVLADLPASVAAGTCTGDLAGTFPGCTVVQASGNWSRTGIVTQTISGDVQDYTGCNTASVCKINGGAADRIVGGLAAGTNGRNLRVCNVGTTNRITLPDEPASGSSATNQFRLGASLILSPKRCTELWYDGVVSRWMGAEASMLTPYATRSCTIPFGSTAAGSPPIASDDDVNEACGNNTGLDWQITAVKVYANAGTPTFTPALTGGADITTLCTAVAGTWTACTLSGTPIVHSFSGTGLATCSTPPCTLAARVTTAGGTWTFGWIDFTGILK